MADLSPEDQAFIADLHKTTGTPAPPPIAQSDWYQKLAQPVTRAAAHVISGVRDVAEAAGGGFVPNIPAMGRALEQNYYTPAEHLTPFARDFINGGISPMSAAEVVVPQTKTAAAIDAASLALPEAKGLEMMGETLGPAAKLVGSRLGRMGAMTAVGGATGAVTGEGGLAGAAQGAVSSLPEPFTAITGYAGRKLGMGKLEKTTSEEFAQAIKRRMPWIGKLEDGRDFATQFMHGDARKAAKKVLDRVKNDIGVQVRGHDFAVGLPKAFSVLNPQSPTPQRMGFHELDNLITELQQGMGFTAGGAERSGISGRGARALARNIRDNLANDLEQVKPGLGKAYLRVRKKFDITRTMEDIFSDSKLITRHGLNQDALLKKLDEYAEDIDRGLGTATARDLQDLLRRGFGRQVSDIPAEPGRGHVVAGVGSLPHYRMYPGSTAQPVGNIPRYMRPTSKKYEPIISNLIARERGPNAGPQRRPIVNEVATKRAETIAGPKAPPEKVGVVKKITEKVRSGKTPNIHTELSTGRISSANVRKMLDGGEPTLASVFEGVSPQDAIQILAKATQQEKDTFLPVVATKIQSEGSKLPRPQQQMLLAQLKNALNQGAEA